MDEQTELHWLRHAKAVAAYACKNVSILAQIFVGISGVFAQSNPMVFFGYVLPCLNSYCQTMGVFLVFFS